MKRILSMFIAMSVICLFIPCSVNAKEIQNGYIFIGDSRTVGMSQVVSDTKENVKFIAKVGVGIEFLDVAQEEVMQIVETTPDIQWTIICNLGINDLDDAERYVEIYKEMDLQYADFYVVSVNPVIENGRHYAKNDKIIAFNELMQQQDFAYIDTYSKILNSFQTQDGLHYNADTYRDIYDIVMKAVKESNQKQMKEILWISAMEY